MTNPRTTHLLVVLSLLMVLGCTPRATIRPNPTAHDKGLRFYRPKPYLLITPGVTADESTGSKTLVNTDRYVRIQLEYLPDFSEEYSIEVRPGLGTNNTKINLKDGWNLTQLDQDLDSNVDDNIKAFAELAKATSGFVPTASTSKSSSDGQREFVVQATNIPLGFYESVIQRDACGRKQFYGWRYIGFAPFNGCPSSGQGASCISCETDLYGLVFREGVMTFAPLSENSLVSPQLHEIPLDSSRELKPTSSGPSQGKTTLESRVLAELERIGPSDLGLVAMRAENIANWTITTSKPLTVETKSFLQNVIAHTFPQELQGIQLNVHFSVHHQPTP